MSKAYEVVMYMDEEWLDTLSSWLEHSEMDAEESEICRVISVKEIEVGDEYVNRY